MLLSCFFVFFFCGAACGILVLQPGIKPVPPAVGARSLNHWTARDVPAESSLSVCVSQGECASLYTHVCFSVCVSPGVSLVLLVRVCGVAGLLSQCFCVFVLGGLSISIWGCESTGGEYLCFSLGLAVGVG